MILFPADALERAQVERDYAFELEAAQKAGFETAIFDFDALVRGEDPARLVWRVPQNEAGGTLVYRGWMLRAETYERLETALAARGWRMINGGASYRFCHHLPENYPHLQGLTPRSVWIEESSFRGATGMDWAAIFALLEGFGEAPLIVKDWVKSQKHFWHEACFIPSARDRDAVRRVVTRFLELQGELLTGGLVFREFVPLKSIGTHPKSAMPLTAEWRIFWANGLPICVAPQWDAGNYAGLELDLEPFTRLAQRIPSRFFSMDVAQTESGEWLIVELGDGQVAGLPRQELAGEFYAALKRNWR